MIILMYALLSLLYGIFRSPIHYIATNEVSDSMKNICSVGLNIIDILYLVVYINYFDISNLHLNDLYQILLYLSLFTLGTYISKITNLKKLFNTID